MSMTSEVKELLHKVQMSQICLADMIHDCKTSAEAERRGELIIKYELVDALDNSLREWQDKVSEFDIEL